MSRHNENILLDVRNISFSFRTYAGEVQAVRGVSFRLERGKSLGIVGESGCGKSVTAKSIVGLNTPEPRGFLKDGEIWFEGNDLAKFSDRQMRKIRAREIRMIFQDPMTSLNPTMPVGKQIMEGILKYGDKTKQEAKKITLDTLAMAGIPSPEDRFKQYPHEFSGGMRQRTALARALTMDSKVLLMDEPFSALDKQTSNRLREDLQKIWMETKKTILFITHSVEEAVFLADRVVVLSPETGQISDIVTIGLGHPRHVYSPEFVELRHQILEKVRGESV